MKNPSILHIFRFWTRIQYIFRLNGSNASFLAFQMIIWYNKHKKVGIIDALIHSTYSTYCRIFTWFNSLGFCSR